MGHRKSEDSLAGMSGSQAYLMYRPLLLICHLETRGSLHYTPATHICQSLTLAQFVVRAIALLSSMSEGRYFLDQDQPLEQRVRVTAAQERPHPALIKLARAAIALAQLETQPQTDTTPPAPDDDEEPPAPAVEVSS
jgi:hypothetical protein